MKTLHILTLAGLAVAGFIVSATPARAADYCREFTRRVTIGDQVTDAYGTACQQPDGSWKIQNKDHAQADVPEGAPGPAIVHAPPPGTVYADAPPPPNSNVVYIIHDDVPVYLGPEYVHGPYWHDPGYYNYGYGYGYPYYHHHHYND